LIDLLEDLCLLPSVLLPIVVGYNHQEWELEASESWKIVEPYGISIYGDRLYICSPFVDHVFIINTKNGNIIQECNLLTPGGIDIDTKKERIYIGNESHIHILSLKLETIDSWELPESSIFLFPGN